MSSRLNTLSSVLTLNNTYSMTNTALMQTAISNSELANPLSDTLRERMPINPKRPPITLSNAILAFILGNNRSIGYGSIILFRCIQETIKATK